MKKIVSGIVAGVIILAGGVALFTGTGETVETAKQQAVANRETRMAVIDGRCPENCEWSREEKGLCYCLTESKAAVVSEVEASSSLDSVHKSDLYVCHDKKWEARTIKHGLMVDAKLNCVLVVSDVLAPDYEMAGVDSWRTGALRDACVPCTVSPGEWGECPYCLHPDWHRTCADACSALPGGG